MVQMHGQLLQIRSLLRVAQQTVASQQGKLISAAAVHKLVTFPKAVKHPAIAAERLDICCMAILHAACRSASPEPSSLPSPEIEFLLRGQVVVMGATSAAALKSIEEQERKTNRQMEPAAPILSARIMQPVLIDSALAAFVLSALVVGGHATPLLTKLPPSPSIASWSDLIPACSPEARAGVEASLGGFLHSPCDAIRAACRTVLGDLHPLTLTSNSATQDGPATPSGRQVMEAYLVCMHDPCAHLDHSQFLEALRQLMKPEMPTSARLSATAALQKSGLPPTYVLSSLDHMEQG